MNISTGIAIAKISKNISKNEGLVRMEEISIARCEHFLAQGHLDFVAEPLTAEGVKHLEAKIAGHRKVIASKQALIARDTAKMQALLPA